MMAWPRLTMRSASPDNPVCNLLRRTPVVVILGRGASAADIAALQSTPAVELPAAAGDAAADGGADPAAAEEGADPAAAEDAAADATLATPEQAAALQAWTGLPLPVLGWRVIDQFARVLGGEALADGPLPSQLITVANAADVTLDENGNYIGVADYKEQFAALWGLQ